jgi:hypothetical protein
MQTTSTAPLNKEARWPRAPRVRFDQGTRAL